MEALVWYLDRRAKREKQKLQNELRQSFHLAEFYRAPLS
jgi:hypothetical protein